jgi:hypothetical protein
MLLRVKHMTWNRLFAIALGALAAVAAAVGVYHAVTAPSLTMLISGPGFGLIAGLLALIVWLSPIHAEMVVGALMLAEPYVGLFFFPLWSVVGVLSCLSGVMGLVLLLHGAGRWKKLKAEAASSEQGDTNSAPHSSP